MASKRILKELKDLQKDPPFNCNASFAVPKEKQGEVVKFSYDGQPAEIKHGSVVIAAITSCTNTSNPSIMIKSSYETITSGNPLWNELSAPGSTLYSWDSNSSYIHEPPYFKNMTANPPGPREVKNS